MSRVRWKRTKNKRKSPYPTEDLVNKVSKAVSTLERNIEKKHYHTFSDFNIPVAGNWNFGGLGPYNIQGPLKTDRIGDKITVKSLSLRFAIQAQEGRPVRVCVAYDRRPTGAMPTAAMMFETTNHLLSGYNVSDKRYAGRFKFIYDKTFNLSSTKMHEVHKMFFEKDIQVEYNGGTSRSVADIEKNHFVILACSWSNGLLINVDYEFTFKFTDV